MIKKEGSHLYSVWSGMVWRCYRKKHVAYKRYGGRGIKVCDDWLTFDNFVRDMLPTHAKGLTLDRIDNDKGYNKENCRWASHLEQARNTKTNRYIEYKGEKLCMKDWAKKLKILYATLHFRLKSGWSIEEAFGTKVKQRKNASKRIN